MPEFKKMELTDIVNNPDLRNKETYVETSGIARGIREATNTLNAFLRGKRKFLSFTGFLQAPNGEPILLKIGNTVVTKDYSVLQVEYEEMLSALKASSEAEMPITVQGRVIGVGNYHVAVDAVKLGDYTVGEYYP